jgi:hypothetical protein
VVRIPRQSAEVVVDRSVVRADRTYPCT